MLKDRASLENNIQTHLTNINLDKEKTEAICNYCFTNYNIPRSLTADYIGKRQSLSEASEFILFVLFQGCIETLEAKNITKSYFSEIEIETYSKAKYKTSSIKFPLVFKMVRVSNINNDQWIGRIDAKTLMELRKNQLIAYNENTQRTMQKIIRGDKEFFKIKLNRKAIKEISNAFKNGTYISDDLTLNIPFESEADFYYDDDTCRLVIKSLKTFDIIDGYHRYIALSQIMDLNSDFNYEMELRITNYNQEKAQRYIFQKDQKTKMSKINSDSFNVDDAAVMTVTRLNEDSRCNIKGTISRNEGNIPFAEMAMIIKSLYFTDVTNKNKMKEVVRIEKHLMECFNLLTEYDEKYFTKKYSYAELLGVLCTFNYFLNSDKTESEKLGETVEHVLNNLSRIDNRKIKRKQVTKSLKEDFYKLIKEVI